MKKMYFLPLLPAHFWRCDETGEAGGGEGGREREGYFRAVTYDWLLATRCKLCSHHVCGGELELLLGYVLGVCRAIKPELRWVREQCSSWCVPLGCLRVVLS